jgi:hypothetical protein
MKTLVYQSFRRERVPSWVEICLKSVSEWASMSGFDYHLIGDEIFDLNPSGFNEKVKERGPIKSDLARLKYAQRALSAYERVIWLDADALIFHPERFVIDEEPSSLFGRERWVQPHRKGVRYGWKIYKNVCNALCVFKRGDPTLAFYAQTAEKIILRADPQYIAPQMIGPKLLTALHSIAHLEVTDLLGSASPHVLSDLSRGDGGALSALRDALEGTSCVALNLCGSLSDAPSYEGEVITIETIERAIERLLSVGLS